MVPPLPWIAEAKRAQDGTVGAGELGAYMRGPLLAMREAGDNSGCEWTVLDHDKR